MNLSDRLRSEARAIPAATDPAFVARIQAAVHRDPGGAVPQTARIIRWPALLAAAAVLVVAAGAVWLTRPEPPSIRPVAVAPPPVPARFAAVPVPPSLGALVAAVPASGPLSGEIAALGQDIRAAAQAVRGAVPF